MNDQPTEPNPNLPATTEPQEPTPVALMVTYHRGQIGVKGPIDNPLLCYGLLESAKDAIRQHAQEKRDSRIAIAPFLPPGLHTK